MAGLAVRESVTLAGRPEKARAARTFVSEVLGPGHPCGEVAVLLVSEVFGNSVRHSGSGAPGETVTVAVIAGGTALSGSRSPIAPGRGRRSCARRAVMRKAAGGLQLVAGLAARWGGRIVTWFECALEAPDCIPGLAGRNLEDIPGSMAYPELKSNGDSSIPLKPAPSHPRRFPRSPARRLRPHLP
jgi:hypothetical protein